MLIHNSMQEIRLIVQKKVEIINLKQNNGPKISRNGTPDIKLSVIKYNYYIAKLKMANFLSFC